MELGLWSMLSNPAVVKSSILNKGGQTTLSLSNRSQTAFAISVDMLKTLSYDMQSPRLNSASIKFLLGHESSERHVLEEEFLYFSDGAQ